MHRIFQMTMKPNLSPCFLLVMLALATACQTPDTLQPTEMSSQTSTVPALTLTFTPLHDLIVPTSIPTRPGEVLITPEAIHVERWQEYQTALAKKILAHLPSEEVLCEWDILGRSGNEVYVWAVCRGKVGGASVPAVVRLEADSSIKSVETLLSWSEDTLKLFPADVREKFAYYPAGRARELREHIEWRRAHPQEPPLIVLSATPTP